MRAGGGQTGLRQRLQRQMLAHQQVAGALLDRRVPGGRELDDDMAPRRHGAELGLLAASGRAADRALHCLLGQMRVVGCRIGPASAFGQAVKTLERRFADDQVAGQVVAKQRQCAQHVVIIPVARVVAELQLGMGVGKGASDKALRAHVVQKPRQAAVPGADAVSLIDPDGAPGQRHHPRKRRGLALRINPHHRHLAPDAGDAARQQITLRARRADFLHLAGLDQRRQRPRHGWLAGAEQVLEFGAGEYAALTAQGLQDFGAGFSGAHELFCE